MLEVSRLLFLVASSLDGNRTPVDIAEIVLERLGRPITACGVTYLIDERLRPLRILAGDGASPPLAAPRSPSPLLALQVRHRVAPDELVMAVSAALAPLFAAPAVLIVLTAFLGMTGWLLAGRLPFLSHGTSAAAIQLLLHPDQALVVIGIVVLAGLFHELGHAAACHYGGARPGCIGVGIYLIWPIFYNDLSDSYRLSRSGRLRADLGGVYFNALGVVACLALLLLTGYQPLAIACLLQYVLILQQLIPFVRLDGYYIVSDLAGEPDLFGRLRTYLPWARRGPGTSPVSEKGELTRRARIIVAVWTATTVPLLLSAIALFAWELPTAVRTVRLVVNLDVRSLRVAVHDGNVSRAALSGIQLSLLATPAAGLTIPLARMLTNVSRWYRLPIRDRLGVICVSAAILDVVLLLMAIAAIIVRLS